MLPLALGLAAKFASATPTPPVVTATGLDATTLTSAGLLALERKIPRLGIEAPASEVLEEWDKQIPNKSQLEGCTWYGSEGADKETNQRKNRTDLPANYHAVEFSAVMDLEWPKDATTRRDKWTKDQLAVIAPYEGEALTVTGFIVALRPQANNSETTNCGAKGEQNTDWHIALVGDAGDPESQAMVVETTPRIKRLHPNWQPSQLKPFVGTADSVRVSGYLLMDPVHKGHLGKYRRTLWEIHPIHRIEVFDGGRWRDIDDPP
jgi:hypothetical protein